MGNVWSRALEDYDTAMRAAGRSPGTIRLHRHYLSLLWTRHRSPWRITTGQLREVLAEHAWSPETRKSARTVFRSFYRWAHGVGLVDHDPALLLETVRVAPVAWARVAADLARVTCRLDGSHAAAPVRVGGVRRDAGPARGGRAVRALAAGDDPAVRADAR